MKVVREARNQNGDSGPMKRREAEFKTRRDEGDWRIMIGNIGTFPNESESKGKLKLDVLKHLYTSSDTDILLINEHNLNTRNITEKPQDIMKNWVENTQGRFTQLQGREEKEWDNKSRYEDGGTGIVTNRRATARFRLASLSFFSFTIWAFAHGTLGTSSRMLLLLSLRL